MRHRGQILVETAIVLPIAIFVVLGALQIMLIQHGRVMTEYAAYCAARAGIVNDANWNVMRNAALVATLPIYGRTDRLDTFTATWSKTKGAAAMTGAVDTGDATVEQMSGAMLGVQMDGLAQDVSLIEIEVTSPDANAYTTAQQWQYDRERESQSADADSVAVYSRNEIDFDDTGLVAAHPEVTRLALNVRVLYPLRIPVVGRIIFELWLLRELFGGVTVTGSVTDWASFSGRVGNSDTGAEVSDVVRNTSLSAVTASSQWGRELSTLRDIANQYGVYLVPLRASYAMQMQSNSFSSNQREPTWFSQ